MRATMTAVVATAEKNQHTHKAKRVRTWKKPKKEVQYIPAYLPGNLDLEDLLRKNKPWFNYHIDNFKYIIGLLTEIPLYNKDILKDYDYIPILAETLQSRVHEYKRYIDYLMDNDVLETDNQYIIDEKSKGYQFTAKYSTPIKRDFITKPSLVKWNKRQADALLADRLKYDYLCKWFTPDLKIDYDAAMNYLNEELKANKTKEGVEKAMQKHNCAVLAVEKIADANFRFSVDKTVGRCHTNLTNIKSPLRNFMTYKGQKMVSVDIKNSQPCFSGLLFDLEFWQTASSGKKGGKKLTIEDLEIKLPLKFIQIIQKTILYRRYKIITRDYDYYIMLVNQGVKRSSADIQDFLELVQNGLLYELLNHRILEKTGEDINRKRLKEIIFTVLFTDNRFIGQRKAAPKKLFQRIFPDVYAVFAAIKRHDSTLLPRLLQAIEAKVMLDHVAKRISIEKPDMPLFTIHDSIACPVGYEDYVARVIKEEMKQLTGMCPTVKYEYWCPSNLQPKTQVIEEAKRERKAA